MANPKAPEASQKPAEPPRPQSGATHPETETGQPAARPAPHSGRPSTPYAEQTVADEQRARSEEIQKAGVDKWKADHDERAEEEKAGKPVTGVNPGAKDRLT